MNTKLSVLALFASLTSLAGCLPTASVEEGGANANDRTKGGEPGEILLTGAMEISPSGHFAIMQRNTITVLLDVAGNHFVELPEQLARVAFSKKREVAYALLPSGAIEALDLATAQPIWRTEATFASVSLLRVTDDDASVLVVDGVDARVLEPSTGAVTASAKLPSDVSFGAFLPSGKKAVLVGKTTWTAHAPSTPVTLLDLGTSELAVADIPNCEAPPAILPDGSRVLVSPTFCEEDKASDPQNQWTNPDPVSVIDLSDAGLSFLKNLPGFGPVALSPDGSRAVAYLDTKRIDASMFDDKSLIPGANAPEYHLMVIDPKTLAFTVSPIGDALPRFAMSRDGKELFVDSSVKIIHRAQVSASGSLTVGPNGFSGEIGGSVKIFDQATPFGAFDLEARRFVGFQGPQAGLDRFIQLADGKTVITLAKRADGLGGVPFLIDVDAKTTRPLQGDYGTGVRDVGLLPDGETILLRFRQPATQIGSSLYARETYCLSLDGETCAMGRVDYQASVAFATANTNDCANMGHDCW